MSTKDVAIGAAILNSSAAANQRKLDSVVGTEQARNDGERAQRQADQIARSNEITSLVMQNAADKARIGSSQLRQEQVKNQELEDRLMDMEREMAEMRETMKEWVASQRGLLALAKALKEEVQTCPNHEHHKLANKDICDEIGDAAAQEAFVSPIPNSTPVFSPKNPLAIERAKKKPSK